VGGIHECKSEDVRLEISPEIDSLTQTIDEEIEEVVL
jgi:hypothetical protein